jgi:amidase
MNLVVLLLFIALRTSNVLATFKFEEATVTKINAAFDAGTLTSVQLVQYYLSRIDAVNNKGVALHAVIEVNKEALDLAAKADKERKLCKSKYSSKCLLSRLHGIPILLKARYNFPKY